MGSHEPSRPQSLVDRIVDPLFKTFPVACHHCWALESHLMKVVCGAKTQEAAQNRFQIQRNARFSGFYLDDLASPDESYKLGASIAAQILTPLPKSSCEPVPGNKPESSPNLLWAMEPIAKSGKQGLKRSCRGVGVCYTLAMRAIQGSSPCNCLGSCSTGPVLIACESHARFDRARLS